MSESRLKFPLYIIIGPSGSGKTSVSETVFPKDAKIVTHTTRPMRPKEKEGLDYYFETDESFELLLSSNQLVEQDNYHSYSYGVSLQEILAKTKLQPAYAILTYSGLKKVYYFFPKDTVIIFFNVSRENVHHRLQLRDQNQQLIRERLTLYDQEIALKNCLTTYPHYHLLNGDQPFSQVVNDFRAILS